MAERYDAYKDEMVEISQIDWDLAYYKLYAISKISKCSDIEKLKKVVSDLASIDDISMRQVKTYEHFSQCVGRIIVNIF